MKSFSPKVPALAALTCLTPLTRGDSVMYLLTDCSHEYSLNLSSASRTQDGIFPGDYTKPLNTGAAR